MAQGPVTEACELGLNGHVARVTRTLPRVCAEVCPSAQDPSTPQSFRRKDLTRARHVLIKKENKMQS